MMPTPGGLVNIQDWSRLLSFEPNFYFRPRSSGELEAALGTLRRDLVPGGRVRILGSLHSCAPIVASEAILDLTELPRELEFSPDASEVTLSAHWTLHDFLLEASRRGKSLLATGGTDAQMLAGLISTNTAPATPSRSVYQLLEWVEYLTFDPISGAIVTRHVGRDQPAFLSVVGSLGTIGVLSRLKFKLVDELFFKTIQKIIPLDEALRDIDATSQKYDFWRVDWVPDSDHALLWAANQIPRAQADPEGDYKDDQSENILGFLFKNWDAFTGGHAGPLLDGAMSLVYKLLATFYNLNEIKATGPLRNMLPVDRRAPLRVAMAEWSFAPADLPRVLACCRDYFRLAGWPNMPIEIELSKTDNYHMSPWNWAGLPHIVKFNFMYLTEVCKTPAEKELIRTHLKGLWDSLLGRGIPFKAHWGKLNFMDYAFVSRNFQLAEFEPLICPPFLNPYLSERLLKPTG